MPRPFIHHATSQALWQAARSHGEYRGTPQDRKDGFIHFSTTRHIVESVERYLKGCRDLVLLSVDPARLGAALTWEPSRDGVLFPHLYGPLDVDLVETVDPLPLGPDGRHRFPEWIHPSC